MIKKIQLLASLLVIFNLLIAGLVFAAGPDIGLTGKGDTAENLAKKSGYSPDVTETTLSETVGQVIKVALSLVGTVFLALTVYAGILWMTAGGNEEKVESAKKIVSAAVIGLVLTVAAYGITVFILVRARAAAGQL